MVKQRQFKVVNTVVKKGQFRMVITVVKKGQIFHGYYGG